MAVAKIYTLVFVVVVLAIELAPGPFFGPEPTWLDTLVRMLPGLAMLAVDWVWMLRIRNGIERP
jgi:hypothetical protein